MRRSEVMLNHIYAAKVSGKLVSVRILTRALFSDGWIAINLATGREICIRTAARLRWEVEPGYLEQIQQFPLGDK